MPPSSWARKPARRSSPGCDRRRCRRTGRRRRLVPGDRVVGAHRATGVGRLVEGGQYPDRPRGLVAVVVPLVGAGPGLRRWAVAGWARSSTLTCPAGSPGGRRSRRRPARRTRASRTRCRRPSARRRSRRRRGCSARSGLLGGVEDVTGGVQEDHCLVLGQVARGEGGRVLGRGDRESLAAPSRGSRGAGRDRVVPEAGRAREDQHARPGLFGRRRDLGADQQEWQ